MKIINPQQLLELTDNTFLGELPKMINSQINFEGKNNILVCEDNVTLLNSRIDFNLDNSILYLSSNTHEYSANISIHNNNVCYIGKNNFFNGITTIVLSESKNFIIGDECLISYNVTFRVSDGHVVYNSDTKKRLNYSKSIYVGDHVWLGQSSLILKGTKIGSGAIIGANSVLSNKHVPSNTTFAGNPARLIHENSFWTGHSVHNWDEETTAKMNDYNSDRFVYKHDDDTLNFDDIEKNINEQSNNENIIKYIESTLLSSDKNRFYLKKESKRNFKKIFS